MQNFKRVLDLLEIVSKKKIKQFNFFNWIPNVKNQVVQLALTMCKMIQSHLSSSFFKELQKNYSAAGGKAPTLGLSKEHFSGKVMLQTAFPIVLPPQMILNNFHKKILMLMGAQLHFSL